MCVVQAHPNLPELIPVRCRDQPAAPSTPRASPASSTLGISLPPGAVLCSQGQLGMLVCGFAENVWLLCIQNQPVQRCSDSSRDALNGAPGSRSRLRFGVWSRDTSVYSSLAWLSDLQQPWVLPPSLCRAQDPGSAAGTPPLWAGLRPPQLSWLQDLQVFTRERSHHLHPIVSQALRATQEQTQFQDRAFGLLWDLNTAETWSRGIGINPQVPKVMRTKPPHSISLAMGRQIRSAQPSCSPQNHQGKAKCSDGKS